MKIKNLVWLIPDGVRNMPFDDPLGRFDFFDELIDKKGFSEFVNMYTAAPSTFMSFISFLSGVHSIKLAERYGFLKSLKHEIPHIKEKFSQYGFNTYFFTWHADLKNYLNTIDVIKLVDNKDEFLEGHLLFDSTNRDTSYIKNIIKKGLKEPFVLFIHTASKSFSKQHKQSLSYDFNKEFKKLFETIEKSINMKETMFIIHSDHGYPTVEEYYKTHDLVITQDNIRVPFLIKIPGVKLQRQYDRLSSLLDIYPTLMDIFKIKNIQHDIDGKHLFFNTKNRVIRVDNRFPTQPHRKTALIKNNMKLVYEQDKCSYQLFKIDDFEEENIPITDEWIILFESNEELIKQCRNEIYNYNMKIKRKKILQYISGKKILGIMCDNNKYLYNLVIDYNINYVYLENLTIVESKYNHLIILVENIYNIDLDKAHLLYKLFNNTDIQINIIEVSIIDSYGSLTIIDYDMTIFLKNVINIHNEKIKRDSRNTKI